MVALDSKYHHSTLTRLDNGSEVVSALGYERSAPVVRFFFSTILKWEDNAAVPRQRHLHPQQNLSAAAPLDFL